MASRRRRPGDPRQTCNMNLIRPTYIQLTCFDIPEIYVHAAVEHCAKYVQSSVVVRQHMISIPLT